jgi:hypothetical protein
MKIILLCNVKSCNPIEGRIHGATVQKTVFLSRMNFVWRKNNQFEYYCVKGREQNRFIVIYVILKPKINKVNLSNFVAFNIAELFLCEFSALPWNKGHAVA